MTAESVWFYLDRSDEQRGPVTRAELLSLARQGAIKPEALVWRQGFAAWQAFRDVRELQPGAPASPAFTAPVVTPAPRAASSTTASSGDARVRTRDSRPTAKASGDRAEGAARRQSRTGSRAGLWAGLSGGAIVLATVVAAVALREPKTSDRQARVEPATEPTVAATAPAPAQVQDRRTPVRVRNPFDAAEVFEFPPGTSQAEAHDQVAAVLRKRAEERLRKVERGRRS